MLSLLGHPEQLLLLDMSGKRSTATQARIIQQRKQQNHDDNLRTNQAHNIDEMLPHDIVRLCKDQYGCRYLRKQIETKNVHHIQKIFDMAQILGHCKLGLGCFKELALGRPGRNGQTAIATSFYNSPPIFSFFLT
ncbi:hypothetical protein K490DRAFT_60774 [Saccharata proteae CBS 121410]|uniref:Uncharacterized protein n=1 Tax=Saccharata proteae CBS 121410 TaxID=1314787 RepID=A0A9P4I244_9PEZI|nr:hypothetical protein K490DRAFT_60774 [Saccharata proteae CBS 121410]